MHREPELFCIDRAEVEKMFDEHAESIRSAIAEVTAALETETIRKVKEEIIPATLKALDRELDETLFLRNHIRTPETNGQFVMAADQLMGLRDRMKKVEIDITKIRLAIEGPGQAEGTRKILTAPGMMAGRLKNIVKGH